MFAVQHKQSTLKSVWIMLWIRFLNACRFCARTSYLMYTVQLWMWFLYFIPDQVRTFAHVHQADAFKQLRCQIVECYFMPMACLPQSLSKNRGWMKRLILSAFVWTPTPSPPRLTAWKFFLWSLRARARGGDNNKPFHFQISPAIHILKARLPQVMRLQKEDQTRPHAH